MCPRSDDMTATTQTHAQQITCPWTCCHVVVPCTLEVACALGVACALEACMERRHARTGGVRCLWPWRRAIAMRCRHGMALTQRAAKAQRAAPGRQRSTLRLRAWAGRQGLRYVGVGRRERAARQSDGLLSMVSDGYGEAGSAMVCAACRRGRAQGRLLLASLSPPLRGRGLGGVVGRVSDGALWVVPE